MNSSTLEIMNGWKEIAAYHRAQLVIAEKKIEDLIPEEDKLLSASTLEKMVIAFETRPAYKHFWKKAVEDGLISNVQSILDECYHYFLEKNEMSAEFIVKAEKEMGKLGSAQMQRFTLKVIQYMKSNGSFIDESGGFDTFEDTAGGCDEITQEAGIYLIENSSD